MTAFEDWKPTSIGRYVELINGFAFPSDGFTTGDGIPLIRIRDLNGSHTEVNYHGKYNGRYLVKSGDLLIGMDGDFSTVKWKGYDALLNQRVCKLVTKDRGSLDQEFLFQRIGEEIVKIHQITTGTTVKHLSSKDILAIVIDLPCKQEQTKIAEILLTLDRAIEGTEKIIDKQQRIKAGLTQDLLTAGIDEHGNLRSQATHGFKDSATGRIPQEWRCESLSYFVPSAEYGISTSLGELGQPVLRMNNLLDGRADISDLKYTDRPVPEHLWLRWGDVLFNRTNSWEHVGRTGIWRSECEQATFASYLVRLNPDRNLLSSELLNIWLNWSKIQMTMREFATPAVHQVNINPTNLRKMPAAFPSSVEEQNEIVGRVNKCSDALCVTRVILNKLRSLRTGLKQDLLTGTTRVTALLSSKSKREKAYA